MALRDALKVRSEPLTPQQERWLERIWGSLDRERLAQLLMEMVNIPSPTGSEAPLARFAVERMADAGLKSWYQPISETRGNAIGQLPGAGTGAHLMFYGHLDHYVTGGDDDALVTGGLDLEEFHSTAIRDGEYILGAGAGNPKAGCAVALHVLEAVHRAGVDLSGTVSVALVSGGIHKVQNPRAGRRYVGAQYEGMGIGCDYLLKHGFRPDLCVSTKPGYSVSWEEPGVVWLKLTIHGVPSYVARRGTYRRPIEDAAVLIPELSDWLEAYAERNSSVQAITPGHIGAIEGGWPYKPDFGPGACNLYLDIRVSPDVTVDEVLGQFQEFIREVTLRHPHLELSWEPFAAMPGNRTAPDHWVVQSCVRAWERVEGVPHQPRTLAGMTDAAILRMWGIPTARLGGASDRQGDPRWGFFTHHGASLDNLMRLARCYAYVVVDLCTRPREQVLPRR